MAAYQPIQMPGGSGDFSDAFDGIFRAREASKKREQDRAEFLLKQQALQQQGQLQQAQIQNYQSEAAQRAAAEADRKTGIERTQKLDIANAIPKIRDMLTPGHPGYDPEAGMSLARAYGINLAAQAPQMPTEPIKRDIGPTQVEYGPRISPDDAQNSAIASAKTPPDQPEARADEVMNLADQVEQERQRFEQANDPAKVAQNVQAKDTQDAAQENYTNQVIAASKRSPTYQGTSPVGPVSIDPNAIIAAREAERKRQQNQLAPLTGAVDKDFQPVVSAMVQAGMPPSEIAKAVADYRKQMATDNRDKEYKPTVGKQDEWHRLAYAAAMANARAKGAAAGDFDPAVGAAVSKYLTDNPGDIEGAFRIAGTMGSSAPGKTVQTVAGLTKPTESQSKDARQAALGQGALEEIKQSGYTPSKDDIQTWLNNQKQVALAQKAGEAGGISGLIAGGIAGSAQRHGALAQSEVEGLPPAAQQYFGNVRRYMESIGRAQSGAAISGSEWQNFFNQFGPNSAGGNAAARRYFEDQAITGGVATRQLRAPRPASTKNDRRADTIKSGGKRPSLDDLAAEHDL